MGGGNVSFFADDASVVVYSLAPLTFKPTKCTLVPLADLGGWEATKALYAMGLAGVTPEWSGFSVASSATYLGAQLGPAVDHEARWAAAAGKFSKRVLGMARTCLAPSAGLKYVAMLTPPHSCLDRAEDLAVQRLLRMPHKALPRGFAAHLASVGLPRVRPLAISCCDMLRRSARRHADDVRQLAAQLAAAREENGSLMSLVNEADQPDRLVWRARALVDDLQESLQQDAEPLDEGHRRAPSSAVRMGEVTSALLPRIAKWFRGRLEEHLLRSGMEHALNAARKSAPCYAVALLRTWCDGWGTSHRRGVGDSCCLFCGRKDSAGVRHLLRCPLLQKYVSAACGVAMPCSFRDALCLLPGRRAPGAFRSQSRRPSEALFRLAVASETYHKVAGRWRASCERHRPVPPCKAAAAAKSAARKFRSV